MKNILKKKKESIEIIKQGEHNKDSGPDFFNGKIKIMQSVLGHLAERAFYKFG